MADKYFRSLTPLVLEALKDTPAVFINGPRQSGKTTLVMEIAKKYYAADYVTFDDATTMAAASYDPEGFIQGFNKPVVIDEVQLVPEIFRCLKKSIDESRLKNNQKAKFILTGSANIMTLPKLADALVGRVEIFTLYPLSAGEIMHVTEGFIDKLYDEELGFLQSPFPDQPVTELLKNATFPELASNKKTNQAKWFGNYLTTLLQRDVRALAEIEKVAVLPNLLKLIAARVGGLLNDASLARDASLNTMTTRRYRLLLRSLFLINEIPAWSRNINKRLVKSPKVYLIDTALLAYLLGFEYDNLNISGKIIENFVASELIKQLALDPTNNYNIYHFRTQDNKEVDFVIEKRNGKILGIEVKASKTIQATNFQGLKTLQDVTKKDFVKGIILYQGKDIIPFGDNLFAMPIAALWNFGAKPNLFRL